MIRAGVIGVGSIGRHHVRIYKQFDDVHLAGIADIDGARCEGIARRYNVTAYASYQELLREGAVGRRLGRRAHRAPQRGHTGGTGSRRQRSGGEADRGHR